MAEISERIVLEILARDKTTGQFKGVVAKLGNFKLMAEKVNTSTKRVQRTFKDVTHSSKKFRMEFLSLGFAGMALASIFGGL